MSEPLRSSVAEKTGTPGERPGLAGTIPAVMVEGLGRDLVAGLTTSERNFRFRDRTTDLDVAAAYRELEQYARAFGGWLRLDQVHGNRVVEVGAAGSQGPGEGDGLVLRDEVAGLEHCRGGAVPDDRPRLLTISVADCVPVYLAWPGGYGLVHAGWRGVAAGVLEAGLSATRAAAQDLRVHLGPAVGGCCYEVGPEVVAALFRGDREREAALSEGLLRAGRADRAFLDLRAALSRRARAAGVRAENLRSSRACTVCDGRFHSFRRSRGREPLRLMLAFLGKREP